MAALFDGTDPAHRRSAGDRRLSRRSLRGHLAPGLALLALVACAKPGTTVAASTPADAGYFGVAPAVGLDQGSSVAERNWFHHAPQGTATLPVPFAWFRALEQPRPTVGAVGKQIVTRRNQPAEERAGIATTGDGRMKIVPRQQVE